MFAAHLGVKEEAAITKVIGIDQGPTIAFGDGGVDEERPATNRSESVVPGELVSSHCVAWFLYKHLAPTPVPRIVKHSLTFDAIIFSL